MGRDFAPRVSSALHSGLTADCTQLVIGDHTDPKTKTDYKNLLYQIRPAFGGNIIATIVNPDHRPQMATVREGVMRKEYAAKAGAGEVKPIDWRPMVQDMRVRWGRRVSPCVRNSTSPAVFRARSSTRRAWISRR